MIIDYLFVSVCMKLFKLMKRTCKRGEGHPLTRRSTGWGCNLLLRSRLSAGDRRSKCIEKPCPHSSFCRDDCWWATQQISNLWFFSSLIMNGIAVFAFIIAGKISIASTRGNVFIHRVHGERRTSIKLQPFGRDWLENVQCEQQTQDGWKWWMMK